MAETQQEQIEAVADLLKQLTLVGQALEAASRALEVHRLHDVSLQLQPLQQPIDAALDRVASMPWPQGVESDVDLLSEAARVAAGGVAELAAAFGAPDPLWAAYRALRARPKMLRLLIPLVQSLPAIDRLFREASAGDPKASEPPKANGLGPIELIEVDNGRGERGGYSLYVPPTAGPAGPPPLIVALHGGSGHGASFVFSWLREARSRGALLLCPTSVDSTWSLYDPPRDGERLHRLTEEVLSRYGVDRNRVVLTGMSDGGTFTLLMGLFEGSPFSHLAPCCGVVPPLSEAGAHLIRDRQIFLVHGERDWMFPVAGAREAAQRLGEAGAAIQYREVTGLPHVTPLEVHPEILEWAHIGLLPEVSSHSASH